MNKEQKDLENYKLLFDVVLHESKAMWETSQLFLISNTILATILGASLSGSFGKIDSSNRIIVWLLSILGLVISILWGFSYNRTSKYYKFRMAQIRKIEPTGFNIFKGIGKSVSDGNNVEIEGKNYTARVLGLNFRSLFIVNIIIALFIIFFILIAFYFLPWNIYATFKR